MTLANLRFVERTSKTKTVDATMYQRTFGKGSILPFVKNESMGRGMAIEPEAELIAAADQIDVAEKTFHDAHARRNEAQIAYLREPSVLTREALEAAKAAEVIALEILNAEVRWMASTRATTVTGLKLKASYACMENKLADSIVVDILRL